MTLPSDSHHSCYKTFIYSLRPKFSFQSTMSSTLPASRVRKQPQAQPDSPGKLITSIKSLVRRRWQPSSSSRHSPPNNWPRNNHGSHARRNEPTEWDWDLPMRTPPPQYARRESYPQPSPSNTEWDWDLSMRTHPQQYARGESYPQPGPSNTEWDWDLPMRTPSKQFARRESYPQPSPSNISNQQHNYPRRGRRFQNTVISMADYLTLAQLENIWQQQDIRRNNPVITPPKLPPPPTRTTAEKRVLPRILQVAASPSSNSTSNTTQVPHQLLSNRDIHPALRPGPISRNGLRIDTNFSKLKSKPNKKAPVNG